MDRWQGGGADAPEGAFHHPLRRLGTENPAERLMKAEALRELGRFREALTLLEMDNPADLAPMANLIRRLAQKRDPAVRELPE